MITVSHRERGLTFASQLTHTIYTCRDYKETLEVVCEKGSRDKYGLLNWTVAQDTDDIVYYQSYTHEVTTLNI